MQAQPYFRFHTAQSRHSQASTGASLEALGSAAQTLTASQAHTDTAGSHSHWACTTCSLQCPGTCCDMWCSPAPFHKPAASSIEALRGLNLFNLYCVCGQPPWQCVKRCSSSILAAIAQLNKWLCQRAGVSCQCLQQTEDELFDKDAGHLLPAMKPVQSLKPQTYKWHAR